MKKLWRPGTMLNPVPAVMVSCQDADGKPNIITVAWAGTVCSDPPMLSISINPLRYSHQLIQYTGEFVVNLPTERLAFATDWCGVKSGRDVDKFAAMGLTAKPAHKVRAPLIEECPINIECRVSQVVHLGSHDLFIASVEAVDVNEELITPEGRLVLGKAGLFAYVHGEYFSLGKPIGKFGFSVKKRPRRTGLPGRRTPRRDGHADRKGTGL